MIDPPGSNHRDGPNLSNQPMSEMHTSWLDTFGIRYSNGEGEQRPIPADTKTNATEKFIKDERSGKSIPRFREESPNRPFGTNTYFEVGVNFEEQHSPGHRHSFWLMPATLDYADAGNAEKATVLNHAPYDDDIPNGTEIDIFEHEHIGAENARATDDDIKFKASLSTPENDIIGDANAEAQYVRRQTRTLFMKSLGGPTNPKPGESKGVGNTANLMSVPTLGTTEATVAAGDFEQEDYARRWRIGDIPVDGITTGWHAIGLLWTDNALRWFVDGQEVVRDLNLVPRGVRMYMLLTREIAHGLLSHYDPRDFEDLIPESKVKVRYCRTWDMKLKTGKPEYPGAATLPPATTGFSAPTSVVARSGDSGIELSWAAVGGASGYNIERNAGYLTSVSSSAYVDNDDLTPGTAYR